MIADISMRTCDRFARVIIDGTDKNKLLSRSESLWVVNTPLQIENKLYIHEIFSYME